MVMCIFNVRSMFVRFSQTKRTIQFFSIWSVRFICARSGDEQYILPKSFLITLKVNSEDDFVQLRDIESQDIGAIGQCVDKEEDEEAGETGEEII